MRNASLFGTEFFRAIATWRNHLRTLTPYLQISSPRITQTNGEPLDYFSTIQLQFWTKQLRTLSSSGLWVVSRSNVDQKWDSALKNALRARRVSSEYFKILVSEETVELCQWESETWKFGFIKQVDKGRVTTVKDLESWGCCYENRTKFHVSPCMSSALLLFT